MIPLRILIALCCLGILITLCLRSSALERVEQVVALAHGFSEHLELQQDRLVRDEPLLRLVDGSMDLEQHQV